MRGEGIEETATAPARPRKKRSKKRIALWIVVGLVVAFGLIQLVPYGRDHTNPAASNPIKWNAPQTETLARRACYDCHSNETKWWSASDIAPASWLIYRDVKDGRARFNFSDWRGQVGWGQIAEAVQDGEMPPKKYTLVHSDAKLTDAEKQQFIDGVKATLTAVPAPTPAP